MPNFDPNLGYSSNHWNHRAPPFRTTKCSTKREARTGPGRHRDLAIEALQRESGVGHEIERPPT